MDKLFYEELSEQYVISALLGDFEVAFPIVKDLLPLPEFFYGRVHKQVYARILELDKANMHVDFITVSSGQSFTFSEMAAITTENFSINDFFPPQTTPKKIESHCRLISEAYHKNMISLGIAEGRTDELSDYFLGLQRKGMSRFLDIGKLVDQAYARLELIEPETVPYPYGLLRSTLKGIEKGSFIIVAARPSTGKSVMVQDFALYAAKSKKKVLFVSAEMPEKMLTDRLVASLTRTNLLEAKHQLSEVDYKGNYIGGLGQMAELPMDFIFSKKIADIESYINDKKGEYDLVVVDYLQDLMPVRNFKGDYEKVTNNSSELVTLARRFNIPFVVAAQINRDAANGQPSMSDIKGSGQIEQDADVVIALWRNEDEVVNNGLRKVRIDILKNRNGIVFRNGKRDYSLFLEEGLFSFKGVL